MRQIGYVLWSATLNKPVAPMSGKGTPRIHKHEARAAHEASQFDGWSYRPVFVREDGELA
jgi:hypothetical protein